MSVLNMMSPGILVREVDLTTIIPGVSNSIGAYVGEFNWGPVYDPVLVGDEAELLATFGIPTTETSDSFVATSFFSCANFLAYTNALYVVRTVNSNSALNASSNTTANKILVNNKDHYINSYYSADNLGQYGDFVARYPGKKGNALKISICANTSHFSGNTSLGISAWPYRKYFENPPGTSSYIGETFGNYSANDEMHMVVVDTKGEFAGTANTVLERFPYMSKAADAVDINGQSSYYKNVLLNSSRYIYALDFPDLANTANTWGTLAKDTPSYYSPPENFTISLDGGLDGTSPTAANVISGWMLLNDKDKYEISLAIMGACTDKSFSIPQTVLDDVILGTEGETPIVGRRDTMLFISPRYSDVVDQAGFEVDNIVTDTFGFLGMLNRSSSYIVVDSGWKYQYDRYNNVHRWIPLNADIAGLCAYTDTIAETWYSPAGFNRGHIKNVTRLAWSPKQADRDALYKRGVNPVISVVGEGIVLLGDKTLQAKPSAFDRINVRRLFITLEKSISRAAKYSLFEFNDPFTRAQFVALIEPYLRTVQSRRGITAFRVICDETNNTPEIIDRNAFVASLLIKPARSINFIELSFVAVRTGVEFSTVIGQF